MYSSDRDFERLVFVSVQKTGVVLFRVTTTGLSDIALARDLENGVGFGTTELHVLRPGDNLDARFLFYTTMSHPFRKMGESTMYGAGGQKRVSDDFIQNLRWPIAAYLDRETKRIDALVDKIRDGIDRLKEYRTAVTGRIDVREQV